MACSLPYVSSQESGWVLGMAWSEKASVYGEGRQWNLGGFRGGTGLKNDSEPVLGKACLYGRKLDGERLKNCWDKAVLGLQL